MRRHLAGILPLGLALALTGTAQAETVTFTGAGEKLWTVPAGVTSLRADVVGGRGGAGGSALFSGGGFGARVATTLAVTPGTTLFVEVAANGQNANGNLPGTNTFGGGGVGGSSNIPQGYGGGAGGGSSDIRLATAATVASRNSRLVTAGGGGGGGGGGGDAGFGGEGGAVAGNGTTGALLGGGAGGAGATVTAGGSNGAFSGIFYSGGSGQNTAPGVGAGAGGAGGGGYYGGAGALTGSGGGSRGGGGGAGSSFVQPGITSNTQITTDSTAVPAVTLTFTPPAGTPATPPGTQTPGGGVVTATPTLNTYIDSRPRSVIRAKRRSVSVKFEFSSNVDGATFRCKLDDRDSASCKSGKRYTVSRGSHRFRVWAVQNGQRDLTPASFSFSLVRKR